MRYVAEISYDGSNFYGWQKQPGLPTVQESIETVLTKLNSAEPVSIMGAGRTDSGVHAKGQVCAFEMKENREPYRIMFALNSKLPESISVLRVARVRDDFNVLLDAKSREYKYFIWNSNTIYPHLKPTVYWLKSLNYDWDKASKACSYFEGEHDFSNFCRVHRCPEKPTRILHKVRMQKKGSLVILTVRGNGFLTNMIRIMLGSLEKVAKGEHEPEWIKELFTPNNQRSRIGRTFPAQGLFLWRVLYNEPIWNSHE